MKCPLCGSSNIELVTLPYKMFRHFDYADLRSDGNIGQCNMCQLLFNGSLDDAQVEGMLLTENYAQSKQTNQTQAHQKLQKQVTRSFLQAEFLFPLLKAKQPSILDIGCFNGELLIELDQYFDSSELHGFDTNPHLASIFPKVDNFHFWTDGLENVQGQFDLICLSHSIMYVPDLNHLTSQIKRLIQPDGIVFIQTPNISKNLCSILLGDQYYYFTPTILTNLFRYAGFDFSVQETLLFPREILGIATYSDFGSKTNQYLEDRCLQLCVENLDSMTEQLIQISSNSRTGVLGTTVNAAFVDSILKGKNTFFADENPNQIGKSFREKEVIHPSALDDKAILVIPYGSAASSIEKRFSEEYNGQFFCV
jgi:SAM-dependent methyltransferase